MNQRADYADHLRDVLSTVSLAAPSTLFKDSTPCEYSDHLLLVDGVPDVIWRTVTCINPPVSAIEIYGADGRLLASAHSIGCKTLPNSLQVDDVTRCVTHDPDVERSAVVRCHGNNKAIVTSRWEGFFLPKYRGGRGVEGGAMGHMKSDIFFLKTGVRISASTSISSNNNTYVWWDGEGGEQFGFNLSTGSFVFPYKPKDLLQHLCIGCCLALHFTLCQPRPPPIILKDGSVKPYATVTKIGVLSHSDSCTLHGLVAAGIHHSTLPRWFHAKTRDKRKGVFYQMPYRSKMTRSSPRVKKKRSRKSKRKSIKNEVDDEDEVGLSEDDHGDGFDFEDGFRPRPVQNKWTLEFDTNDYTYIARAASEELFNLENSPSDPKIELKGDSLLDEEIPIEDAIEEAEDIGERRNVYISASKFLCLICH